MFRALLHLSAREGRKVPQAEVAGLVAKALGNGDPVSPSTVGRWLKGSVPDLATLEAIAVVCGVDPGWLTFGRASSAPAPGNPAADQAVRVESSRGKRGRKEG